MKGKFAKFEEASTYSRGGTVETVDFFADSCDNDDLNKKKPKKVGFANFGVVDDNFDQGNTKKPSKRGNKEYDNFQESATRTSYESTYATSNLTQKESFQNFASVNEEHKRTGASRKDHNHSDKEGLLADDVPLSDEVDFQELYAALNMKISKISDSCTVMQDKSADFYNGDKEKYEHQLKLLRASAKFSIQNRTNRLKQTAEKVSKDINMKMRAAFKDVSDIISSAEILDVCFLVDCTGSMSSWIDRVKTTITNIFNIVIEGNPDIKMARAAFVGYRDYGDSPRFDIHELSKDIEGVKKFITDVKAHGGADTCEDMAGGLRKALDLSWMAASKVIFLIADAPCHGKEYHENCNDNHPRGDTSGLSMRKMTEEARDKRIQLISIRLNESTDKLFKIMKSHYETGDLTMEVKNLESTDHAVWTTEATASISQTFSARSKEGSNSTFVIKSTVADSLVPLGEVSEGEEDEDEDEDKVIEADEDAEEDDDDDDDEEEEAFSSGSESEEDAPVVPAKKDKKKGKKENDEKSPYDLLMLKLVPFYKIKGQYKNPELFHTDRVAYRYTYSLSANQPLDVCNPKFILEKVRTRVCISRSPFDEGVMRYAHLFRDQAMKNRCLAAKVIKRFGSRRATTPEQGVIHLKSKVLADLKTQIISQYLARDFNRQLATYGLSGIDFLDVFVYELEQTRDNHYKWFSAEPFMAGSFRKYNNNKGWFLKKKELSNSNVIQAFSHFTFQHTQAQIMVVDLQGVGNLLTDPQIHTYSGKGFGEGNLGFRGQLEFFSSHKCTDVCQALNLTHPFTSLSAKGTCTLSLLSSNDSSIRPITALCPYCQSLYRTTADKYMAGNKTEFGHHCDECHAELDNTENLRCEMCRQVFICRKYAYHSRGRPLPRHCHICEEITDLQSIKK